MDNTYGQRENTNSTTTICNTVSGHLQKTTFDLAEPIVHTSDNDTQHNNIKCNVYNNIINIVYLDINSVLEY